VKGEQRLAGTFFERHRGHGVLIAFIVRPDDARQYRNSTATQDLS
jgi:hypothetical protein